MSCEFCGDPAIHFCEDRKADVCKGCCESYIKFKEEVKT